MGLARPEKPSRTHTQCDKHGRQQWKGTVICGKCERVYQMRMSEDMVPLKGATGMQDKCQCGARLAPESNVPGGGVFWARKMCTPCFIEVLEKAGLREPDVKIAEMIETPAQGLRPEVVELTPILEDVRFPDPERQAIFEALSQAFDRQFLESLADAAKRMLKNNENHPYADEEPVLRAARIVLGLDTWRKKGTEQGLTVEEAAWKGMKAASDCLKEPTS